MLRKLVLKTARESSDGLTNDQLEGWQQPFSEIPNQKVSRKGAETQRVDVIVFGALRGTRASERFQGVTMETRPQFAVTSTITSTAV